MPRLTLDKTELHPGDTLTVTVANAPAESDRVQIWTSGTCCRGLPAMDAVGLGTPKDGDIPLTAPQKPADYYVVLLGTPQEPDGSPHIITQSGEFHVMSCLPGEQGCAPAGTDTRWFYDTDAIGSVRLVTDDGGGTFARYDYAPFGEPTLVEDPDNPRRFAGKELDAESGLNYFGARYFAAELGRFTAADPGQADGDPLHPQSWNAYAYSRNNPFRFVDPLGTCSRDDAGNLVEDNESSRHVYGGPCLRYDDGVTVTPSGPTFHDYYAGVFASMTSTAANAFDTLVFHTPWEVSWIAPVAPMPLVGGVGPAGSIAWNPETHALCASIGVGGSAGHNVTVGPLTGGRSSHDVTYPEGADDILNGGSVSFGINSPALIGAQLVTSAGGQAWGPTIGVSGFAVAATTSTCVPLW